MHENRRRAGSFGDDAEQYDRSRPSYPTALVDDLLVDGARRVIDVGCGTGIVSRLFVERGCEVVGVEPDERMAAVARQHGLVVDVSTFEAWELPGEPFDLLVSGQAWHWVDPDAGPRKAAEVLRRGGRFAVFWNWYLQSESQRAALIPVYERKAPEIIEHSLVLGNIGADETEDDDAAWLEPYGFAHCEHRAYRWQQRYERDEWLDQLPTHSDHRTLPAEKLAAVLDGVRQVIDEQLGGAITIDHTTRLVTAIRT